MSKNMLDLTKWNLHSDSPMLYYYLGGRKMAEIHDTNLQHFPRKK